MGDGRAGGVTADGAAPFVRTNWDDDPPVQMMADDVSGYLIDGIITSMLVALVLGGLVGVVVQLLGRRVSSSAAGVLFVLALVAAPVAVARPARSSAVSSQGNRLVARRLP